MAFLTTEAEAAAYLGAMIDGEGSVMRTKCRVSIYNSDPDIIEAVKAAYRMLGIRYSVYPRKNGVFSVDVASHDNVAEILRRIPVFSRAKRERIEAAVARRRWRPLSDEYLRAAVAEGRPFVEMCRDLGCGWKRIQTNLARLGLAHPRSRRHAPGDEPTEQPRRRLYNPGEDFE